jgi:diguanylate cyclase (GGDEF)-like protein
MRKDRNRSKYLISDSAATARRTARILAFIAGTCLIAAFAFGTHPTWTTVSLSALAFVAGGISLTIGSADGKRSIAVDTAGIIALGSALACGPVGAAGPSALAAIGGILLVSGRRYGLRRSIYDIARLPAQAAIAALAFTAAGGHIGAPVEVISFPAALAAMAVYAGSDRVLSKERASNRGLAVTSGLAYALSGTASALPPFVILAPALPLSIVLLSQLHRPKAQPVEVEAVQCDEDVEEEDPARASLLDAATGLANHRYLDMFLQQELSRAERFSQPISVLMVDIDNFTKLKSTNDPETIVAYMTAIGAGIKGMLRDYDIVARYKDDEFVIVLPETEAEEGSSTARRLHAALSGNVLPLRARFSVGVATYPTHGMTADNLLSSAHHALNRAKFSGKNTVLSCHELAKTG